MKTHLKVAVVLGALALATAPAALAVQPADPGSRGKGPQYAPEKPETPGPGASLPEKAKAATDDDLPPGKACKGLSRKHVKGEQGTEFSRCVKAAAKLRKEQDV